MKHAPSLSHWFTRSGTSPAASKKKRPSPISIRVSEEEREELARLAGNQSINAYVRARIFSGSPPPRTRGRAPVKDYEALARALSLLGRSDLQTRLSSLLIALQSNTIISLDDLSRDVQETQEAVHEIRDAIVKALGLSV